MKNNMLNDQELENVVGGITSLIMSGASRYTKLNSIITGWSTSTRSIPQPVPF